MKTMNKKQIFTTLFCVAVLMSAVYVYLSKRDQIDEAISYLQDANLSILLLLIPAVFLMWRSAGRIWYPYLKDDGLGVGLLSSIQYEINFVDTVLPFFNATGVAYALVRLKKLKVSEGRASGMILFRYIISVSTKWVEIALAMAVLIAIGKTGEMPAWVMRATIAVVIAVFILALTIYKKKIRVPRKLMHHRKLHKPAGAIQEQLGKFFKTLDMAFSRKDALLESFIWGLAYSLLEVLPFWVVATSMGHPELLLQIIVASGVAIVVGIVIPTPMGIGGFDGAMILCLSIMGSSVALASAIVVTTRILILGSSALTGIPFWMNGMRCIEGKD